MTDLEGRAFTKRRVAGITCLVPSDTHAEEWLATIGLNKEVIVQGRRVRNIKHHRLLFAVLRLVFENTDLWESETNILDELKMLTGLYEIRVSKTTGEVFQVPRSISSMTTTSRWRRSDT